MGYLIFLGLLVAFSMAILNPYGRKVLGVMALTAMALIGVGLLLIERSTA
ncbi:MAG TPA: hypothetical protein VG407_10950 [Caulobacteraceae bacterium]|jgi:hypothetical protein|nr:hypothetical protein [Caulobacteraceae bacterium]